ncbi:ATPase [Clostridium botulinum]|uniref:ATPase n=1 Tax=Clostridium botulinum C/D str. DC5 TaxID=1443128 RepID=A0A0A0ID87_CLOBO|nr:BadF/BadG/BcrA/BcrD ATPase family protein [Clostridium botulinum]KEI05927.1 ATPase [Clostridium botulinum C/D str. BKT75002]KEI12335.1 ATPase [Clostridium botulinum C/D str. BKT2873]KGM95360.1 ATPase [Clostridium botulinum D str. CCUG 7971]KGM97565.1 ATPase [Clostridium botulinum C/D str. DC5]KOC47526.1 ATPase [Clostridium botulinum]
MYYLGIDGGGTKTAFVLINEEGKILGEIEKSTCHHMQVGFDGFKNIIQQGIEEICNMVNINNTDIEYTFLGIPGYGEVDKDDMDIEEILKGIFNQNKFTVGNDVVAGWAGSLACREGINLVAGTGSIAYGVNEKNESARSGGWGYFCGDEGSAYWIAKKGIEIFTKEADGRLEKGQIYNVFKEELNLKRDFDLISLIHEDYKLARTKIAKLALLVARAAELGDKKALDIYKEAANEFYLMIKAVIGKLEYNNTIVISYSGGVFKAGDSVLIPLKQKLKDFNCDIRRPLLTPVVGSALYAYKLAGNEITDEIVENLKKI